MAVGILRAAAHWLMSKLLSNAFCSGVSSGASVPIWSKPGGAVSVVAGGADDDAEAEDDDAAPLNGVDNDDRGYVGPTV